MKISWAELRRRKVIRVAIAYVVVAWLMIEVGDTLFDMLELPAWLDRALLAVLAIGLPLALVLSWVFDFTPDGGIEKTDATGEGALRADGVAAAAPRRFEFAELGRIDLERLDLGRPQLTPLFGRAEECALIERRLEETARGRGGLILIGGAPGEGKTRLGEEALDLGLRRGMLPLLGQAYEENDAPLIVSTEIVEDILQALPVEVLRNALGDTAPEIARLVPDLRRAMPDIPPAEVLPPEQQQRFFFNAMLEFTRRLSGACPLVILLDDMQWADESSAALLEHIAPRLQRLPVLFVVTYRDMDADLRAPFKRALSRLAHQDYVTRIRLRPLGEAAVSDMIESLYGQSAPASLVALIRRETGGNAFFAKSLFQHLAEEGELFDGAGSWRADLEGRELPIPDGIRLVIERRLERQGEDAVAVLSAGAVEGLRFDLRTLETALADGAEDADPIDPKAVLAAVESGEDAGLIFAAGDERLARYEFSHALVRQALLEALSPGRRQRLHLRLGRALESLHGEAPGRTADIAGHYYRAGDLADPARTLRFLELAGGRALETAAGDEAVQAFSRALELTDEPATCAELLYRRGLAYRIAGDVERNGQDWLEALPVFEAEPNPDRVAEICWTQVYDLNWANEHTRADAIARRGLAVVDDAPSVARCRLLAALGMTVGGREDFDLWKRHADAAVDMARDLGDDALLTEVLLGLQRLGLEWMQADIYTAAADEAVTIAERAGPFALSYTLASAFVCWLWKLRFDRIDANWAGGLELAHKYVDLGNVYFIKCHRGMSLIQRGRLEEGAGLFEEVFDMFRGADFAYQNLLIEQQAHLRFLRDDWEHARSLYEEITARPIERGPWVGTEAAFRALFLAYVGDPEADDALRAIEPRAAVAGQANPAGAWLTALSLLEGRALLGQREAAAALHAVACQLADGGMRLVWNRGLVSTFCGIAAAAGAQWSRAAEHFRESQALIERHGLELQAAELLRWRAQMRLWRDTGDDRERARSLLEEAAAAYRTLGMSGHARLAEQMAADKLGA